MAEYDFNKRQKRVLEKKIFNKKIESFCIHSAVSILLMN